MLPLKLCQLENESRDLTAAEYLPELITAERWMSGLEDGWLDSFDSTDVCVSVGGDDRSFSSNLICKTNTDF